MSNDDADVDVEVYERRIRARQRFWAAVGLVLVGGLVVLRIWIKAG